jgi:hypothetical protein
MRQVERAVILLLSFTVLVLVLSSNRKRKEQRRETRFQGAHFVGGYQERFTQHRKDITREDRLTRPAA